MRTVLGCVAVLALACGVSVAGQGKVDGKKLVGKWVPVPEKDKKALPMTIEFTADGKVSMTVGTPGAEHRAEGTYTLTGDKLAVQLKVGDTEVKDALTVKKLTDTELTTEDSKGKSETLRRKQ
jgi:uncharacterized protein (TIGR03066 family)